MASTGYEEFILSELEHIARVAENRLTELVDAVRWERECDKLVMDCIMDAGISTSLFLIMKEHYHAPRAAVDALVEE